MEIFQIPLRLRYVAQSISYNTRVGMIQAILALFFLSFVGLLNEHLLSVDGKSVQIECLPKVR
jgi:hypothetical protein